MLKKKTSKINLTLSAVMSSLIMLTITLSTFAYWEKQQDSFNIPTDSFNATEEEFTYYACVPNVSSTSGYDYYDLESIPTDLVDRVTGLAVVRFEALTKTAYIPSYPGVNVGGTYFNYNDSKELPVIHVLNSISSDDISINNGFSHIETLIIPETVTYIQPGSFSSSTNLSEVSILGITSGENENAGYLYYQENEFGTATIHKEDSNRTTYPTGYILSDNSKYLFSQFNGSFEYDNLTKDYFTYVIPKVGLNPNSIISNITASSEMEANVKYKLTFDGTNLTVDRYTYELSYSSIDEELTLNTNVNYEEYIISSNFGTVKIEDYPQVYIREYINNDSNIVSNFNLSKLNASYSRDNSNYEIKFSPSYIYESTHYYGEESDLNEEKVLSQISVEKAYFLNQVTTSTTTVEGEKVLTITTPYDEAYQKLYIKGCYTSNSEVYYPDPSDSANSYIEMELVDGNYRFEFRESLSSIDGTLPDKFVFYKGRNKVNLYPSYVSIYSSEDDVISSLQDETYGTKRIYLEMYSSNNVEATRALIEADHTGEYVWYVVYWYYDSNGNKLQHKLKMHYADRNSTFMIVDLPTFTYEFKFIRLKAADESKLDTYLDSKNNGKNVDWSDFVNYSIVNLKLGSYNRYWFESWGEDAAYSNQFTVTNGSNLENNKKYNLRNKNFLVLDNYGETGKTKYIPIQENLGYSNKDVSGTDGDFNLEFTCYAEYLEKSLQEIALPKGTIVNARILNINIEEEDTYFADLIKYSDVSARDCTTSTSTDIEKEDLDKYFAEDENGNLAVQKDCIVNIYIKVGYDAVATDGYSTTPVSYGWHFDIKKESLENSGFDIGVQVDENGIVSLENSTTLDSNKYIIESREIGKVIYPCLTQTGNVIKLDRNHSNKEFEEYHYLSGSNLNGNYVISTFYDSNINFGGVSGNTYYGIINDSTPSGELILNNENAVMFTPNGSSSYQDRYFAAFDDYGNFLTFLSFNRNQTVNEGYQCLSFTIPDILSDFRNVYIYEVDSDGNIIYSEDSEGNKVASRLNDTTNIYDIVNVYNTKNEYTEENENYVEIVVPVGNDEKLLFDYYLKQLGASVSNDETETAQYRTNNDGFSYGIDDSGDKLYYYNNIKLATSDALNSTERYKIFTRTNYTTGITLSNNDEEYALDEQIIDGYYYNDITITGTNSNIIRFMDDKFEEGYYDLVLRVRNGKYYLGYKYLGKDNTEDYDYYLYMYDNNVFVDSYKMDSMNNGNHYFVDICYQGTVKFDVYTSQGVLAYQTDEYTLSSLNKISRFYLGATTPIGIDEDENPVYLKQLELDKIGFNINFGEHPDDETNIRYTPTIYNADLDYYQVKIKATTASEFYYAYNATLSENILLKKVDSSNYSAYLVTNNFNTNIKIKANDTIIEGKEITLPQPGKYSINYNISTGIITCYKVQEPDVFDLYINDEKVADLEVNPNTSSYYEYVVKNHIVLENNLNLTQDIIEVKDNGNVLTTIEKVTITSTVDGVVNKVSSTEIPSGVYSLTYSIDSSRREGDKYLVFTYINFTQLDSNLVTYHYTDDDGVASTIKKQVVSDSSWEFELLDYDTLTSYLPVGKYFSGWSLTEDGEIISSNYYSTTEDIDLYPIFEERSLKHPVIWLSELNFDSTGDIIFTLDNLDDYIISSVTYTDEYSADIEKYVSIDTGNSKRIVTIKASLFEKIGYVKGGIPLIVNLTGVEGSNLKDIKVKVLIPYPNYSNEFPLFSSYYSNFNSDEYLVTNNHFATSTEGETDLIEAINQDSINWRLHNAKIDGTNSYESTNENDYCLTIQMVDSSHRGYAITDTMFANIKSINFQMLSSAVSNSTLKISLLNIHGDVVGDTYNYSLNNIVDSREYSYVDISINREGAYFIKFEVVGSSSSNYIRIDNLQINCSSDLLSNYYISTFTTGEYSSMNTYSSEDIASINGYSTGWNNVNNVMISNIKSYNNEDESNPNNLCLRFKAIKEDDTQVSSTATTTNTFTNINAISFDLRADSSKMNMVVSIIDAADGSIIKTCTVEEFIVGKYTHIDLDLSNESLTGEYVIKFSVTNIGTAKENIMCLDNLMIKFN